MLNEIVHIRHGDDEKATEVLKKDLRKEWKSDSTSGTITTIGSSPSTKEIVLSGEACV